MTTHVVSVRSVSGIAVPNAAAARSSPPARAIHAIQWFFLQVQRAVCGMFGHKLVLSFETHRLSLRCLHCGSQTKGWRIGG